MSLLEDLKALELEGVAVSAAMDAEGNLSPVGGMWQKLLGEATVMARGGLLHTVVVAEDQPDVPADFLKPNAETFRVIKARTVADAVARLNEASLPRRAIRQHEYEQCKQLEILERQVSIETHYQLLPFLLEVRQEKLPRTRMKRWFGSGKQQEEERDVFGLELHRWEEEQREVQIVYKPKPYQLAEVFRDFRRVIEKGVSDIPRLIVVGPPGSGKTTLIRYLAWAASLPQPNPQHDLGLKQSFVPVRVRLRDWEDWFTRTKSGDTSLPAYLVNRYQDVKGAPAADQWRRWLTRGEALLLLDGLDEIGDTQSFLEALQTTLKLYQKCPVVITCRTVSYEMHRARLSEFPVFTLSPLQQAQIEAFITAYPADPSLAYDFTGLLAWLKRLPRLQPLVSNPLLLSYICFVAEGRTEEMAATTRGELYHLVIEKLLTRPKRAPVQYPGTEPTWDAKLTFLEHVALSLFAREKRKLTYKDEELQEELQTTLSAQGYGDAPAPWANALRADLIQNSGLLRSESDKTYFFLHLTVQEFLAASALARIINRKGGKDWETEIEVIGKRVTVRHFVDKKSWSPQWQEVIRLLAERLADPMPLLAMLADEKNDDYLRHRLALAAQCLPKAPEEANYQPPPLVNQITTAAFSFWWRHSKNGWRHELRWRHVGQHFAQVFPFLIEAKGRLEAQTAGTPLRKLIRKFRRTKKSNPTILELIRNSLPITDSSGWRSSASFTASDALDESVTAASSEWVQLSLIEMLRDADYFVCLAAMNALGKIGSAAAMEPILAALIERLADTSTSQNLRTNAASVIGKMGATAVKEPIVAALIEALRDANTYVRREVVTSLGKMGAIAATERIRPALIEMLHDTDGQVRARTAAALVKRGDIDTTMLALESLIEMSRDVEANVREMAASAIGEIGSAAATAQILMALLEMLRDTSKSVQQQAARVVGKIGVTDFIALNEVLHDANEDVRQAAVIAVGELGAPAAREPILSTLVERLYDSAWRVRQAAAEAVGKLGTATASAPILNRLIEMWFPANPRGAETYQAYSEVRSEAIRAFGKIGAAAPQVVLPLLEEMLRHTDVHMRLAAAEAVGAMGPPAATEPIVAILTEWLHKVNWRLWFEMVIGFLALTGMTILIASWPKIISIPIVLVGFISLIARGGYLFAIFEQPIATQVVGMIGAATEQIEAILTKLMRRARRPFMKIIIPCVLWILWGAYQPLLSWGDEVVTSFGIIGFILILITQVMDYFVNTTEIVKATGRIGVVASSEPIMMALAEIYADRKTWRLEKDDALKAISDISAQGVRVFLRRRRKWEANNVEQLSQL